MTHLEFATNLVQQAGAIIKQNFQLGMKKEWKGDGSPVTATDLAINQLVLDSVAREFPDHAVVAEEGSRPIEGAEFTWVCDPIDGTIPFSHGIPTSVFSLALVRDGQPVFGVILDPFTDRLFVSERGKGATMNDGAIQVSAASELANTTLGLAVWRRQPYRLPGFVDDALVLDVGMINVLSVIYMGALVASGELSGLVFPNTFPWDGAALKVLIDEAGGRMTDLFGQEQRYDQPTKGFIASNGHVHDELVALVGQHLK